MGALAAVLSACGSDPDKRCVDRDSYDYVRGYKIVNAQQCAGGGAKTMKRKRRAGDAQWYYDADVTGRYADHGTFSRAAAVERGGFGCDDDGGSGSGSSGGSYGG